MESAEGFPPVADSDARILVLGSLPGVRSISAQQYYAHPRNAFWPIMRELFGIEGNYAERCRQLVENRLALWDVLASSQRPGSLDADIRLDSAHANDFATFLELHPHVRLITFNGRKAEQLFAKFVDVDATDDRIRSVALPSTSPAYAAMSFQGKLQVWREAICPGNTNKKTRSER